jgi:hypothetical protein
MNDYNDRITRRPVAKVTTGQIYWGAVPFVVIQIVMVALVIAFPNLVSRDIGTGPTIDVDKALREMRGAPGGGAATGVPGAAGSGASGAGAGGDTGDEGMRILLESIKRDAEKKP